MIRYAALALALATASAAPAAPEQSGQDRARDGLETALAGLTPGEPVHCISQRNVTGTKVYGDVIVYSMGRNRKAVNYTSGGCSQRDDDILVSHTTVNQYCSSDVIETHERMTGAFTGTCALGKFVTYSK